VQETLSLFGGFIRLLYYYLQGQLTTLEKSWFVIYYQKIELAFRKALKNRIKFLEVTNYLMYQVFIFVSNCSWIIGILSY